MKRYILTFILGCLLAAKPGFAEQQLLDRVVAVVNNDAITQSEVDVLLRPLYEEFRKAYQGQELLQKLSEVRIKILNQLIEDRLVLQEAKDRELQANPEDIENQLNEFRGRFSTEEELEQALIQQGLNISSIRRRLEKQSLIRLLHDIEIRSKVVVSPLEIQDYYESNPDEFESRTQIKVRSITIKKSEEAKDKGLKDEDAWQVVQELRRKSVEGQDFGELAKEFSEDIHAKSGGLGDWIEKGQMIPAIDEVIFSMKEQAISEVIETPMGYHLFRVEERQEGKVLQLNQVRDQIHARLFQEKSRIRFKQWMEELKSKAYISVR